MLSIISLRLSQIFERDQVCEKDSSSQKQNSIKVSFFVGFVSAIE